MDKVAEVRFEKKLSIEHSAERQLRHFQDEHNEIVAEAVSQSNIQPKGN